MIKAFYSLTKRSLPKEFKYFIPITKMILENNLIVSIFIIITMIKYIHLLQPILMSLDIFSCFTSWLNDMPLDFFFTVLPTVINLAIELSSYFLLFIIIQTRPKHSKGIIRRYWKLWICYDFRLLKLLCPQWWFSEDSNRWWRLLRVGWTL